MSVVGVFVSNRISESVVRNSASSVALYMDGFIAPYLRKLMPGEPLDAASKEAVDNLLASQIAEKIVAIKIWGPGGFIIYSSDKTPANQRHPVSEHLKSAWEGNIEVEYDDLDDEATDVSRRFNFPLMEIYAPIWQQNSSEVIAVAEFYQRADALATDIRQAKIQSVLAVGSMALLMALSVSGIVRKGSQTIIEQKRTLKERVNELSALLKQNEALKVRIVEASKRAAETHETLLRRVGAELHDGPTQFLSLALLRLDGLRALTFHRPANEANVVAEDIEIIKHSLDEGLREMRSICSGLALPEINALNLQEVVDLAVRNHERRTSTPVKLNLALDGNFSLARGVKTACYRFVQEGLNNSYRHANGIGQVVTAQSTAIELTIEISDEGIGFDREVAFMKVGSLGLKGLRDRIESLGGEFIIETDPGKGSRLIARLPWQVGELVNA